MLINGKTHCRSLNGLRLSRIRHAACLFSFDVVEFYPSITEDLLDQAILWAKSFVDIPDEHVSIIKHARKSLLFNGNKPWVKRNNNSLFDVAMGSYDGTQMCDLVGLFVLNTLAEKFGKDNIGLYRDDGLAVIKGTSGRLADKARKDLCAIFKKFGLRITAEVNHQVVNFLHITLNLRDEEYLPYRKPNNDPLYIDSRSNHPPAIIQQLPKSINRRISTLSSSESVYKSVANTYESALKNSNYKTKLEYAPDSSSDNHTPSNKRKRKRHIIWFNPPFSRNVRSNIGRDFLKLIDKHFPKTNELHKIFNRNTVKVSYSCLENVKSVISKHNKRVLNNMNGTKAKSGIQRNCNCRSHEECPLQGSCLTKSIVYKAEVMLKESQEVKQYIGMTANTFKERYNNHKKSFKNPLYQNETELSKYLWKLKETKKEFSVKWSVMKRAPWYSLGGKSCILCLEEKLCLLEADKNKNLTKRSEIFAKCRHIDKFQGGRFKREREFQHASANR